MAKPVVSPDRGFTSAWLEEQGLGIYLEAFLDNDIDATILPHLTSTDLAELGVHSIGHRRRLLEGIAKLKEPAERRPQERPSGKPVSAQQPALGQRQVVLAERRQVTTLFCDLVGYTQLASRFDPEVVHDILGAYKDACAGLIDRFGGHVLRFFGDGVLASFGYPRAHEDDAARAVATGLALATAIAALKMPDGERLGVRIGIATGLVVAGDLVGNAATEQDSLVGEAPNLAARLQAEAQPGQVLIAEATANIIGAQFRCKNLGKRSLKGFASPVTVFHVIGEQRGASRFEAAHRSSSLPMISREGEIARLVDRATAAMGGRGQIVLISGEAGVGKSRLIEEMYRRLEINPSHRVILQCSPVHTNQPFHPIAHYLAYATDASASNAAAGQLEKLDALLRGLGQATPERLALVAELLRHENSDRRLLHRLAPSEIRSRTVEALLDIIEAITRDNPVIVIEDIHWMDPSTSELVERLARLIRELPVLLVATMRPGEPPHWVDGPDTSVLHLARLQPDEIRRLVNTIAAEQKLPPKIADAIVARSDGIPIFAEELARGYLAIESVSPGTADPNAIPVTLNETLLARLDLLEHGRETAQLTAAIGRDVPQELLIATSPFGEAEMGASIERLIKTGIFVKRHSAFGEAVGFRHSLLRDAAYHLLLRRDRVRVHKLIADTIEARFPTIADNLPHVLAHQLTEAGDYSRAISYWERAGRDAARRSAAHEAVAHFTSAIELTSKLPQGRDRDLREFDLRLEILGPLIAARGYGAAEVEREIDLAFDLSGRLGANDRIVPALVHKWIGRFNEMEARLGVARQIAEAASQGSTLDKLMAHRCMGTTLLFRGEFAAAIHEFEQFQELFVPALHNEPLNKIGATFHAITVKVGLAEAWTFLGDLERAALWRRAALEEAQASGHFQTLCHTIAFAGGLLAALIEDADDLAFHASRLRSLTLQHDLPFWRPHADLLAGLADIRHGATEKGFRLARHGIEMLTAARLPSLTAWCILFGGGCVKADRIEEGLANFAAIATEVETGERWLAAEFHRLRGLLRLRAGDDLGGLADLTEARRIAVGQGATLLELRATADLELHAKAS
ncbi:MAG: adenylate/guanylate cyclase domain-containing protein [Hyphomicrobiales bacterium]